jgi:hypothetical protein
MLWPNYGIPTDTAEAADFVAAVEQNVVDHKMANNKTDTHRYFSANPLLLLIFVLSLSQYEACCCV